MMAWRVGALQHRPVKRNRFTESTMRRPAAISGRGPLLEGQGESWWRYDLVLVVDGECRRYQAERQNQGAHAKSEACSTVHSEPRTLKDMVTCVGTPIPLQPRRLHLASPFSVYHFLSGLQRAGRVSHLNVKEVTRSGLKSTKTK